MITVFLMGMAAPIYYTLSNEIAGLRLMVEILYGISFFDIYLMFHVGYYDQNGLLMHHPAKTVPHYVKGMFYQKLQKKCGS